jgi:hypothetical protein
VIGSALPMSFFLVHDIPVRVTSSVPLPMRCPSSLVPPPMKASAVLTSKVMGSMSSSTASFLASASTSPMVILLPGAFLFAWGVQRSMRRPREVSSATARAMEGRPPG